jgi:hypothetical protein
LHAGTWPTRKRSMLASSETASVQPELKTVFPTMPAGGSGVGQIIKA